MHSGVHAGLVLLRPGDAARGRLEAVGRPTGIAARLAAAARPDEILVSRGTLGPDGRSLPLGIARPVQVSDSDDIVTAVPVLGMTIAMGCPENPSPARGRQFVGRAGPLGDIEAWLAKADDRVPSLFMISAPPGQGKSYLSEEVARRATYTGMTVARGKADAAVEAPALQPFRQIHAQLHERPDQAVVAGTSTDAALTADTIVGQIIGQARQGRLLIILDDWQWADVASTELLNRLRAIDVPLLILVLSRPQSLRWLAVPASQMIELPPFTFTETAALVRAGRPDLDPLDAFRIHERAGGNPLFVEELCQLPARALRLPLTSRPEGDDIGWISTLIGQRLTMLPQESIAVLHAAAVIGQECPLWLLATLTGATANSEALATLQTADLLIPSLVPGSVRFKHGITWEVVYRHVPLDVRTAIHTRLAGILESHGGPLEFELDEALARHFRGSANPARAAFYYERAGDAASRVAATDRAQSQYGAALLALEAVDDADLDRNRLAKLVSKFGFCCVFDSDEIQLERLGRAGARAARLGDIETEAAAEHWSTYVQHGLGRQAAAQAHCRRALALTRAPADSPIGVQFRGVLGQVLVAAGRYADGAPLLDEAIAIKRAHRTGRNSSSGLAYALTLKAAMLGDIGNFARAHETIAEALAVLAGEPNPVECSVVGWSSAIYAWQGNWPGLLQAATRACELAQRLGTVYIHAVSRAWAAFARLRIDGDPDAALDLQAAIACMEEQGKGLALSMVYGLLAETRADLGDADGTRAALANAFRRHRLGEPYGVGPAARSWARILTPGDPGRAAHYLATARRNALKRGARPELARCDLAAARLGLVPPEEVPRLAARAREAFIAMDMPALAAEAAQFSQGVTVPARSANRPI
jgi:tetratricopeptide (TPR) repeat protein